jgi:hypothetical protein
MQPLGGAGPTLGSVTVTRISVGLCVAIGIVSAMGYLPTFSPCFILSLSSFRFPIPKIWVLFTSTFYCRSIFSAILHGVFTILLAQFVEPVIGSREFLRVILMTGFTTNFLMAILAFLVYAMTGNPLLLVRPYESRGATSTAILMAFTHAFFSVTIPTPCFRFKVRYLPFYSFCLSALTSLFSHADDLIATVFGTVLSYVYIRFIKRQQGVRGDPAFTIARLVPEFGLREEEAPSGSGDADAIPDGLGALPADAAEGGRQFRVDTGQGSARHGRDPFQGQSRTLGP